MGLDVNGTQFLMYAKSLGVDFSRTAMIGRQSLHLNPSELKNNLEKFGIPTGGSTIKRIFSAEKGYAEEFFRVIGAKDVHSFDHSDYEKATHLHDMNQPIPEHFKQQYSVVCDGGSLEHVFNFPLAIKNCMEMVRVGGHFLGLTIANNFSGHGFYQFSPELFFSLFTPTNGFELVRVIAYEDHPQAQWYSVKSPVAVKGRVTLINSKPVYLAVIAKRIADTPPLQSTPQQSDYVAAWSSTKNLEFIDTVMRNTPEWIKRVVESVVRSRKQHGGFNPKFFQPIQPTEEVSKQNDKRTDLT